MDKYDNMLAATLEECKTLPVFFDMIFGFLQRRTDFYHVATEPNSPVGLPPGFAENIVKQAFYKWKPRMYKDEDFAEHKVPEPSQEVCVESEPVQESKDSPPEVQCSAKPTKEGVEFSSSDCYNGAVYNNYSWSQSISDVDVTVKIAEGVSTRNLDVQILSDKIAVRLKDGTVLLEGELCQKCKHKEAIWSLAKNKLEIHLDKCREMWWNCLLTGEPKLDLQKMDCSRPFEELSDEAQAKIEELQWNQERKRLGLPTSDQLSMQEKLKKAWNAEGSPFTGPFDPNAVMIG